MPVADIHAIRGSFFDITAAVEKPEQLPQRSRYIEDGVMLLREGRIISLLNWEEGRAQLNEAGLFTDYSGKLIVPGFIDTHIHYPQTEMIAAPGGQLVEWLQQYVYPAEGHYQSPAYAAEMSDFFLEQLLRNGTTTALVFGSVHPQSVDALFTAAERLGMRLIAGKVMMDRNAPDYLLETPDESYRQTRALIQRWHNRGRLGYALTPRFAPATSPAMLSCIRQLRQEFPDLWVQTHLSETPQEVEWVKSLFPANGSYLDVYHQYQLTGRRSVFAHCLHPEEDEWRCLHQTDSAIAFCPTSNLFLGSGLFDIGKSWASGVKIGIGSDVGAGTTFNMLQTLAEAYKVGQLRQYQLSACEAFYHATLGGARALDLDDVIGNFEPGKEADFTVLDPAVSPLQKLRLGNCRDILETLFVLMTLGDDRNVAHSWVNGRCVWSSGSAEKSYHPFTA